MKTKPGYLLPAGGLSDKFKTKNSPQLMKKFTSILASAALVLALASCGGNNSENAENTADTTTVIENTTVENTTETMDTAAVITTDSTTMTTDTTTHVH